MTAPQTPSPPRICVFRTKVYYAKNDERFRLNPLPKEIVRVARDLEEKEVWAVLYALDREIEITLPWTVTRFVKHLILDEAKNEKDIKEALAFIAFDVANTYLRLILPNVPSILFRDPEHVEIKRFEISTDGRKISGISIKSSGFTIYPTAEGEKVSDAISIDAELYDVPDAEDYEKYSRITVKIDLRKLIDELQIRWDLARG